MSVLINSLVSYSQVCGQTV